MPITPAIFISGSITCLLVMLAGISLLVIDMWEYVTIKPILLTLAFLATWAGITLALMRWM